MRVLKGWGFVKHSTSGNSIETLGLFRFIGDLYINNPLLSSPLPAAAFEVEVGGAILF